MQAFSGGSLMSEKIIHPFYVFQVASIVLWSFDNYYYYAFCIALISTMSVLTTLMDTKKVNLVPRAHYGVLITT